MYHFEATVTLLSDTHRRTMSMELPLAFMPSKGMVFAFDDVKLEVKHLVCQMDAYRVDRGCKLQLVFEPYYTLDECFEFVVKTLKRHEWKVKRD